MAPFTQLVSVLLSFQVSPQKVFSNHSYPQDMEADPRRKMELSIPIIAYPETLWKKQYRVRGGVFFVNLARIL